jgi:hypothetical protein
VDRVHGAVDRGQRQSTVDRGHRGSHRPFIGVGEAPERGGQGE